jgi:hypothetical protein
MGVCPRWFIAVVGGGRCIVSISRPIPHNDSGTIISMDSVIKAGNIKLDQVSMSKYMGRMGYSMTNNLVDANTDTFGKSCIMEG